MHHLDTKPAKMTKNTANSVCTNFRIQYRRIFSNDFCQSFQSELFKQADTLVLFCGSLKPMTSINCNQLAYAAPLFEYRCVIRYKRIVAFMSKFWLYYPRSSYFKLVDKPSHYFHINSSSVFQFNRQRKLHCTPLL